MKINEQLYTDYSDSHVMARDFHVCHTHPVVLYEVVLVDGRQAADCGAVYVVRTTGTSAHKQALFNVNHLPKTTRYPQITSLEPTGKNTLVHERCRPTG